MNIDYTALGVWTGVATGAIALFMWLSDRSRARARTCIDTIQRLQDQFSTERMYNNRRVAAEAFRRGEINDATDAIDEIVDFFEDVAYYEQEGFIGARDAWTHFFSYLYRFYHFCHDYIEENRTRDITVWQGFGILYLKLYRIEIKDRKKQTKLRGRLRSLPRDLPIEDISQFLEEECRLRVETDQKQVAQWK